MHDARHDNIFANDDALDFIIYDELEEQKLERKGGGNSGCLGVVVLLLLPKAVLLIWKCLIHAEPLLLLAFVSILCH